MNHYWPTFVELLATPFHQIASVWGIVPLYFALLLNETTSGKANFRTAIQTGFSFLWAAAQWIYPCFRPHGTHGPSVEWDAMLPVNLAVTGIVLVFGAMALFSGVRRRYPKYCSFLGYTRFANYFMITIYPMQAHYLAWTWERLATIAMFAVPVWLVLHFGLMPVRKWK
ncbi:MAG: hypothetical protein JWQ04_1716 [Pedosphaera sp.]|nr:hypothetical protein [Pedosphaera sp.]